MMSRLQTVSAGVIALAAQATGAASAIEEALAIVAVATAATSEIAEVARATEAASAIEEAVVTAAAERALSTVRAGAATPGRTAAAEHRAGRVQEAIRLAAVDAVVVAGAAGAGNSKPKSQIRISV